jgi:hypothetical protein
MSNGEDVMGLITVHPCHSPLPQLQPFIWSITKFARERIPLVPERGEGSHEWHVVLGKSVAENDIGKKGLSCVNGVATHPSPARRPSACGILAREGYSNR